MPVLIKQIKSQFKLAPDNVFEYVGLIIKIIS